MTSRYRKKPVVIEARPFNDEGDTDLANWCRGYLTGHGLIIRTLEGEMRADLGDWIIKGVKGEFYPCKPEIFDATYEVVVDEGNPT